MSDLPVDHLSTDPPFSFVGSPLCRRASKQQTVCGAFLMSARTIYFEVVQSGLLELHKCSLMVLYQRTSQTDKVRLWLTFCGGLQRGMPARWFLYPVQTPHLSYHQQHLSQSGVEWRQVQSLANTFWHHWRGEYLATPQSHWTWQNEEHNLNEEATVILKDNQAKRNKCPWASQ